MSDRPMTEVVGTWRSSRWGWRICGPVFAFYWALSVALAGDSWQFVDRGRWPGYRRSEAMAVAGFGDGYAVVAAGTAGLQVVDLHDPANPVGIAGVDTRGWATDVVVSGTRAYLIDADVPPTPDEMRPVDSINGQGLVTVDLADSSAPVLLGAFNTEGNPGSLTITGRYAYVTWNEGESSGRLLVFDLSPTDPPALVRELRLPNAHLGGLAAIGNRLFVAAGQAGLWTVDISDPAQPRPIALAPVLGRAVDVAVSEGAAYVSFMSSATGLEMFGIDDPDHPRSLRRFLSENRDWATIFPEGRLAIALGLAFLSDTYAGLHVIDLQHPLGLTRIGQYGIDCPCVGGITDVALAGPRVLVGHGACGVEMLDVSVPTEPRMASRSDTGGNATTVAVSGWYAFLADGWAGLEILDLAEPGRPKRVARFATRGELVDVAVANGHAFLADKQEGLLIVDVSHPTQPRLVGARQPAQRVCAVAVSGDYAYVAFGGPLARWGVEVVDVRDPNAPHTRGAWILEEADTYPDRMVVVDRHVVISVGYAGLYVIDVSDPDNPRAVAQLDGLESLRSDLLIGTLLPCLSRGQVQLMDFSNPREPRPVSVIGTEGSFTSVAGSGSHVFAAEAVWNEIPGTGAAHGIRFRLHVFDVRQPSEPRRVGAFEVAADPRDVLAVGNRVQIAAAEDGLLAFEMIESPAFLESVVVEGRLALSWNSPAVGMRLQFTTDLVWGTWRDVPGSEATNCVTLDRSGTKAFFRLTRQ